MDRGKGWGRIRYSNDFPKLQGVTKKNKMKRMKNRYSFINSHKNDLSLFMTEHGGSLSHFKHDLHHT